MTNDKILTIGDLEKAIEELKKQYELENNAWYKETDEGIIIGLKLALEKIGEVKKNQKKAINILFNDVWVYPPQYAGQKVEVTKSAVLKIVLGDDESG